MTSIEILGTGPAVGNRLELEPAIRYASVTYSARPAPQASASASGLTAKLERQT